MKQEAVKILTNASMATSQTTIGIEINQEFAWSIQAVWSGAPVGTFTIEVSNDMVPLAPANGNPVGPNPAANVVNWVTYTGSSVGATGVSGNWMWISQLGPYKWVRLKYTATSGSGTLNAILFGKG